MHIPSPGRRDAGVPRARHAAIVALLLVASAPGLAAAAAPADSLATPPPEVRRWQTQALRPDRLNHASLALAIGVGTGSVTRSPAAGAAMAIGLGLAKELADDRFDRADLAADAFGAALAAVIVAAIKR